MLFILIAIGAALLLIVVYFIILQRRLPKIQWLANDRPLIGIPQIRSDMYLKPILDSLTTEQTPEVKSRLTKMVNQRIVIRIISEIPDDRQVKEFLKLVATYADTPRIPILDEAELTAFIGKIFSTESYQKIVEQEIELAKTSLAQQDFI